MMPMGFNLLSLVILGCCCAHVRTCRDAIVKKRPGHRCVTDEDASDRVSVDRHECSMMCMHRAKCRNLNYNFVDKKCVLNEGSCLKLIPDEHFEAVFFEDAWKKICLRWVPSTGSVTTAMVPMSPCHSLSIYYTCYVARLVTSTHILPGKYEDAGDLVYSVLHGNRHSSGNKQVLEVTPGCQVAWVPYVAGSAVPHGAVVGGYLADGVGSTLYVIGGVVRQGYTLIGYYDAALGNGWVDYSGPEMPTQMKMLVLT